MKTLKFSMLFVIFSLCILSSCKKEDVVDGIVSVKLSPTSPVTQSIVVSKQQTTNDISIVEFTISANTAISIVNLPITINSSGNLTDLISVVKLQVGSMTYAVSNYVPNSKTGTITFNNFSSPIKIDGDNKINVRIIVDIKPVSIMNTTVINASMQADKLIVFDQNNNQINCVKNGYATGSDISLIN
jgi:hypothetical protein